MKTLICVMCISILTGCGARGFAKQGASYQDFYEDLNVCMYANQTVLDTPDTVVNIAVADYNSSAVSSYGGTNPYVMLAVAGHNKNMRNNCMKYLNWEIRRGDDVFHP